MFRGNLIIIYDNNNNDNNNNDNKNNEDVELTTHKKKIHIPKRKKTNY